jgi:hypothetical protein
VPVRVRFVRYVTSLLIGLLAALLAAPVPSTAAAERVRYHAGVRVSGQVTVSFQGDRAAGCEAAFRCDVAAGTIRWTPSSRGQLNILQIPGRRLTGYLSLFGGPETTLDALAVVQRSAADGTHLCADARGSLDYSAAVIGVRPRTLRFGLQDRAGVFGPLSASPLGTNCGGPLPADVLHRLRTRTVGLRELVRGPTTIDLSGSAPFAAAGLAGTVESTVVVRVRKARVRRVERRPRRAISRPSDRPPFRSISVEYRLERLTGSVPVKLDAEPRGCAVLDACGLSGTLTVSPGPARGEAYVNAYGRLSKAALRRAVGLVPGPRPSKASVGGYLFWNRGRGTVTAALERNGGPACRDTSRLTAGAIDLRVRRRRVTARFAGADPFAGADLLRTRCPGPLLADLERGTRLATGGIPRRALGRRRITLHLNQGSTASTLGYRLRSRPDLTVVLEREKVEEQQLSPGGFQIDSGGGGSGGGGAG